MSGIYLSIFAAYGIIHLVQNRLLNIYRFQHKIVVSRAILLSILGILITTGIGYGIMPHNKPFILYGIVRNNIESFIPVTMQINTLDIKQNDKLIDAISWINKNTEPNAKILGDKDWRGWMEIKLKDPRIYTFSENLSDLLNTIIKKDIRSTSNNNYLILYYSQQQQQQSNNNNNNNHLPSLLYSNGIFKIFRIK